jgi:hypothetical protein
MYRAALWLPAGAPALKFDADVDAAPWDGTAVLYVSNLEGWRFAAAEQPVGSGGGPAMGGCTFAIRVRVYDVETESSCLSINNFVADVQTYSWFEFVITHFTSGPYSVSHRASAAVAQKRTGSNGVCRGVHCWPRRIAAK